MCNTVDIGKITEGVQQLQQALLEKEAVLWKLRWRHANAMVQFFELASQCPGVYQSYYTASGLGPVHIRGTQDFGDRCIVEYKHTPEEWIPIWERAAEKILAKLRKENRRRRHVPGY